MHLYPCEIKPLMITSITIFVRNKRDIRQSLSTSVISRVPVIPYITTPGFEKRFFVIPGYPRLFL